MAQQVKTIVTKADDLSAIPWTHNIGENQFLEVILRPPGSVMALV